MDYLNNLFYKFKIPNTNNNSNQLTSHDIEEACYTLDTKHIFFNYLLAKEDEKKENLLLALTSVRNKNFINLTIGFGVFTLIKSYIWSRGYFAYFFYHTRFSMIGLYVMGLWFIQKNFYAKLLENDIMRYYEKRIAYDNAKLRVEKKMAEVSNLGGNI